jgi:heme-degrading monooxygenase HmoA
MGTGMFVALSRFTIANDKADEVRSAFLQRPHLVDTAEGFLSMDVMCPIDNSAEIWLVTRWCDEENYQNWHKSHQYHESHKGIPKRLKLVPGTANVRLFRVFAS